MPKIIKICEVFLIPNRNKKKKNQQVIGNNTMKSPLKPKINRKKGEFKCPKFLWPKPHKRTGRKIF